MTRPLTFLGAAAAIGLGLAGAADAQTIHHHARHPVVGEAGRQIIVHVPESYLTLGTAASPGDFNNYALSTVGSTAPFNPGIDHTFVGVRGLNRLPNNFTVPGCCVP